MSIRSTDIEELPKFPVEQTYQLEISAFGKQLLRPGTDGQLKSGTMWSTDSMSVMPVSWYVLITPRPLVMVTFLKNGRLRSQVFGIVQQRITFGTKLYLECACGRRALKLYSRPELYGFSCRKCQRLYYELSRIKKQGLSTLFYFLNRKLKIQAMQARVGRIVYRERRTRKAESVLRAIAKWKIPESLVRESQKI